MRGTTDLWFLKVKLLANKWSLCDRNLKFLFTNRTWNYKDGSTSKAYFLPELWNESKVNLISYPREGLEMEVYFKWVRSQRVPRILG